MVVWREGKGMQGFQAQGPRLLVTRVETNTCTAPAATKRCENESLEAEPEILPSSQPFSLFTGTLVPAPLALLFF